MDCLVAGGGTNNMSDLTLKDLSKKIKNLNNEATKLKNYYNDLPFKTQQTAIAVVLEKLEHRIDSLKYLYLEKSRTVKKLQKLYNKSV